MVNEIIIVILFVTNFNSFQYLIGPEWIVAMKAKEWKTNKKILIYNFYIEY